MVDKVRKKLVLHFPSNLINKPIAYHLVKDFNLVINILQASAMEEKDSFLILEVMGKKKDLDNAITFLKTQDIEVEDMEKGINLNFNKCIHCGLCVGLCPTEALTINQKNYEVCFDKSQCIVCDLCLKYCPVNAIEMEFLK
ncbi:MAG: 4Fe-4S dicluster domain-containing protein [Candidatus Margulisbacteria bacterium]|nr:4Fe-4S dicluster domain-containing protein [Candidatus Margulisiibacteriota bacterium]